MQWLYGSGEGAASSLQAYRGLRDFVLTATRSRPTASVVLAAGATLAEPAFVPCADKPLAVVLDADETAIQNLGAEYDQAAHARGYDQSRWERWERTGADKVLPMPGAAEALGAIRQAGVTIVFISNRMARNAASTVAALNQAGLGPVRHGETLFLQGDDNLGSGKDGRRATVAARFCVVAMAGDQLGDFSDLFNAKGPSVAERRRAAADFADKWGAGWFMLSNPVYGPSLRGSIDDIFPADRRWTDPQEGNH
jgi:5'-nucleotidase (lipoprotein e(P4) family)